MVKKSLKKVVPPLKSEDEIDTWFQKADLTEHFSIDAFSKFRFEKLEKKLIEDNYESSLKSQPVTLRLPQSLIQELKLAAIRQGIAYQTLARILLRKNVRKLLLG